jgi:hypothetical protein
MPDEMTYLEQATDWLGGLWHTASGLAETASSAALSYGWLPFALALLGLVLLLLFLRREGDIHVHGDVNSTYTRAARRSRR